MATRSGGTPIRTNKVRSGMDQAFTLPKGTSAAPIKGPGMGTKSWTTRGLTKADIARLKRLKEKMSKAIPKGTPGGKRLSQAEKVKKSAAAFIKRKKQIAELGKKPKLTKASDFIKRHNKMKGLPGGKAMVIGSGLAAGAAQYSIPKYGKNLTAKEKADLLIKHSRKTKRPGTLRKTLNKMSKAIPMKRRTSHKGSK